MKDFLATILATFFVLGFSAAQEKKAEPIKVDAAKILGKWELTKSTDKEGPKSATVVFEKDGKVLIAADFKGKEEKFTGKYEVKGDKLAVTIAPPDGSKGEEQTDTITALTDEKMVLVDKDGIVNEFIKKK